MVRNQFQPEKRGRVRNLTGWHTASKRLLDRMSAAALHDLVAKDTEVFQMDVCRVPLTYTPLFFHALAKPVIDNGVTWPHVIAHDANVCLVIRSL